jgi:hypothetical protein
MANLIGKLKGYTGDREVSASRLAEDRIEVDANSWNTFVTVIIDKLGAVTIQIARVMDGRGKPPMVLSEVKLNTESSESPIFSADGLLREQIAAEAVSEYIADQNGLNDKEHEARSLESDLREDRI